MPTTQQSPKQPLDEATNLDDNEALGEDHPGLAPLDLDSDTTTKTTKGSAPMTKKMKQMAVGASVIAIIAGTATGFGVYKLQAQSGSTGTGILSNDNKEITAQVAGENVNNGDVFGIQDSETFSDKAEGYLEAGGIGGEGSHKLLRPGGPDQTVYLTSSVTDLGKLEGMEVAVWGETNKGQVAGWLMDVGRVEVLNTNGQSPDSE